jgi:zinc transporter ZupT
MHAYAALAAAVALALVHLFAGKLRSLEGIPRSVWLSTAGGVSVAYVFLHLLPELAEGQEQLRESVGGVLGFAERHVYIMALLGLAVFYGLDRLALESRRDRGERVEGRTPAGVFWIHVVSFSIYNALIGYLLLHRQGDSLSGLALYSVAMALHFVVNDYGLREHHQERYHRTGRWVLAAAIVAGWLLGRAVEVPEAAVSLLVAFLAGGIILNVLKEELPDERRSRFWALAAGMSVYAALLLAL